MRVGAAVWVWAHPRPCGEHDLFAVLNDGHTGSSPPVRGARVAAPSNAAMIGLIPARAGSTTSIRPRSIRTRAHPRPCGEHDWQTDSAVITLGSSPPVRGAQTDRRRPNPRRGLIPARAGSTPCTAPAVPERRAHPRPCGEHGARSHGSVILWGSSPPVRGARHRLPHPDGGVGLIPARAGSTPHGGFSFIVSWAHPRPCGEHFSLKDGHHDASGSSPPVRGAHRCNR